MEPLILSIDDFYREIGKLYMQNLKLTEVVERVQKIGEEVGLDELSPLVGRDHPPLPGEPSHDTPRRNGSIPSEPTARVKE